MSFILALKTPVSDTCLRVYWYFAVAYALLNTLKESYRYRKNNDNFR